MFRTALQTVFIQLSALVLVVGVSSPGHSAVITGTIPFASDVFGNTPFTIFGGLTVNNTDALEFTVTYDETSPDLNASATVGEYRPITQVVLTIGASSVTLNPGNTPSDFDPVLSEIRIDTTLSQLAIDIRSTPAGGPSFEADILDINLNGMAGLFSNDGLDPIGGAGVLNLSDFTGVNTALLDRFSLSPVLIEARTTYNVNGGTITFPNSSTNPPVGVPEPATLPLFAVAFAGLAWVRRRERKRA